MKFFSTRKGAGLVLLVSILFGTVFGSARSLKQEAKKITAQNAEVIADLESRRAVCANLYTVAARYMDADDPLLKALSEELQPGGFTTDAQTALLKAADPVFMELRERGFMTKQDRRYVSGFQTQLESLAFTISHSDYNAQAEKFNQDVLGVFPANVLRRLSGVKLLPVYS